MPYGGLLMKDTYKSDLRQFSRLFPPVRVQREVKTEICKWNFTSSLPDWTFFFLVPRTLKSEISVASLKDPICVIL